MKRYNLLFFLLLFSGSLVGQEMKKNPIYQTKKGHFMAGIAFDAIKTDFEDRVGNKLQAGAEVNYFIEEIYSVTLGTEIWTGDERQISGVAGIRFYPLGHLFVRIRGIIGADQLSAGAGFQKPFSQQWIAEGIIDYYSEGKVAARFGLAFLLVKRSGRER